MGDSSTLLSILKVAQGPCPEWHLEMLSRVELKKFSFQGGEEGKRVLMSGTNF